MTTSPRALIRSVSLSLLGLMIVVFTGLTVCGQELQAGARGGFPLVREGKAAKIIVSKDDHKAAQIAAASFAADIELVSGVRPTVGNEQDSASQNIVVIGTLGKSSLIDDLVKRGKLKVSIEGERESFQIETVAKPFPGVESALVIVGSDRRGTAFGVYEMSQRIGVSPWVWWADVKPEKRDSIVISKGKYVSSEPSVKYRGIFLNDEDWGLEPWAAKTFEPETGNIGPKTYAKICELLLRLKANTLWPAMHEVSRPFNDIAANRQVADDYGIVMGSSHAEPMLRNNVGEWKANKDDYNFVTNPKGVADYWEQRVRENGQFENIYTLGMRGIHDSPIQGTKSQAERIPLLEKIFAVQRGLLSKYVRPEVETIPQIFCPYKEVLADYHAGLKVPDDVTIVFPDDNFGYMRAFPNAEERKRKGGFGVYYHISYLGRPMSYLWLNSTPPVLIFEEMSKAYVNGMRDLWILNVGDIKPAEIGIEFFMQMAYDAKKWNAGNVDKYLQTWAKREFGDADSAEIASVMDKYYRLGFQRKPEHLQWNIPGEPSRKSDLTENEVEQRLADYAAIRRRAEAISGKVSPSKKDAFYELVLYPVRSAAFANERYFAAEMANKLRTEDPAKAKEWALRSMSADKQIAEDAKYFNETLAGGKWRNIMSPEMNAGQWPSMRSIPPKISDDWGALSNTISHGPGWNLPIGRNLSTLLTSILPVKPKNEFYERNGVISIEAEHFLKSNQRNGFEWTVIKGLGKTGDSISIFPITAKNFTNTDAPSIEYQIDVTKSGDFTAAFYLLPTQPVFAETGLRLAFSVDGGEPQIVTADKDTEVSSPKWAVNILSQSTIATGKIRLEKGKHRLKVFAVDTGIVLDKIVLNSGDTEISYFGPTETWH